MEHQFRQHVDLWASTGTQRANQKRSTKTLRSQQRAVVDDNPSEDSRYPSSDSSESSAGGVSLRACSTKEDTNDRATRTAPQPHSSDDAATHSQWLRQLSVTSDRKRSRIHTNRRPRRRIPLGARRKAGSKRSDEPKTPSTSKRVPGVQSTAYASSSASHGNFSSFQPVTPNDSDTPNASQANSECSNKAAFSSASDSSKRSGEWVASAFSGGEEEHTQYPNIPKTAPYLADSPRRTHFAYVEDADDDDSPAPRADTVSFSSLAVENGRVRDHSRQTAPDQSLPESEQSGFSQDRGSYAEQSRDTTSPSWQDDDLDNSSPDPSDSQSEDETSVHPRLRTRNRKTSTSPLARVRLRPTNPPRSPSYRNPFTPTYSNYQPFAQNAPGPSYGPPFSPTAPYGPQLGFNIPPYAPSIPGPSYGSPLPPYDPYSQQPSFNVPPYTQQGYYSNYGQPQPNLPYYPATNPEYFQPPPPPHITGSPIGSHTLEPGMEKLNAQQKRLPENATHSAPIANTTLYKPPVSSDPSRHDISFQISLKSSSTDGNIGKGKSVIFDSPYKGEMSEHWEISGLPLGQSGRSSLTKVQSLEHFADRSGQDRITIIRPPLPESDQSNGIPQVLRWLHLERNILCLEDLRELIRTCQYLDEDLITLADRFLEVECAKFEKKYSSGSNRGYYIEPGTVLRCDGRYDQEPSRGEKSVFFCSVPYLQLGKQVELVNNDVESEKHIHPARTLMESLYDYDLLDNRDGRQAILQCSPPEQDSILYIPQIWYLLCGSDVLISYSQLSFSDICGDSIKLQDESNRSLIAVVTDLDNHQFSVALKTTDSLFSAIRRIDALRSNSSGNTIHDYELVLNTDEHLIPKKWLDIVNCDPLPLLEITLKSRSEADKRSRALTVREKTRHFTQKHIADSSASDDDNPQPSRLKDIPVARTQYLGPPDQPDSQGLSAPGVHSPHTYALTSYMGTTEALETNRKDTSRNENAKEYSEQFDESCTPTLVGSFKSRQDNDRRRIQVLNSHGIVVNDIRSISNEPEVFSVHKDPETKSKPNVWDYLVDEWERKGSLLDGHNDVEQNEVSKDDATPTTEPSFPVADKGKGIEAIEGYGKFGSLNLHQQPQTRETPAHHRDRERPIIPFLQWDNGKADKDGIGSDIIVRRVLDQVHNRLSENSDYFKIYAKTHNTTLEALQKMDSPLYTTMGVGLADKILSFRSRMAAQRKNQLFQSSKALIQMFIPINFEHDVTQKVWGAVHNICQTLDSIFKSDKGDRGEFYLVQDYYHDKHLVQELGLTQPEVPMKGCAKCSDGFRKPEDGIAHLSSVHFLTDSINENQSLCLRTAGQVQVEARFYTFLTLLEECTEAFKSLKKTADVLHFGTLRARDSEETKGYPIFESLVRVFEHITIILTFSCDFMVKANKVMRKNYQKALNGEKFKGQLQESLRGIVSRAKKDLDQAKVDIILASKTDSQPGVMLASIGPEFMIGVINNGLFLRQLKDTADNSMSLKDSMNADNVERRYVDTGELYKRYANKLQLQVNQRPQKRLLPDIYALEEELDILLRLNQWQQKFCQDFWRVLDPTSYRITTKARISHFRTESHYLLDTIRRLQVRYNEFHSLQKRAEKLRDQLQQSIEIEEESHGKAIRVFTFVTLFFLPLSFVTSFFGMNTTDIRNIEQDQRLFWVTSIPTTAFVIGVAYLYGYKWEGWKERLNRRRSTRYTKRIAEQGARALRSTVAGRFFQDTAPHVDLERGGVLRRETDLSLMSIQSAKEKARRRISLWLTQKKDAK